MSSLLLTQEEIHELTGRVQYAAQRKVLNFMGVEHRARPDGSLAVLRAHVEQILGLKTKERKVAEFEPNWAACNEPNRDAFKEMTPRQKIAAESKKRIKAGIDAARERREGTMEGR